MWKALLSLLVLFIVGRIILFFLDQLKPSESPSQTEVTVFSFSLGYAVLTVAGIVLAQFNLLTPPISLACITALSIFFFGSGIYLRRRGNPRHLQRRIRRYRLAQVWANFKSIPSFFNHSLRFSHLFLLVVYAVGIFLRLESQLAVPWLGDMDPYYHLFFIDSIMIQGGLPSRTLWGAYSYPPSFHVVPAALIGIVQVDRFIFMKVVPEFLGFLCIPAVYALVKRRHGEWAGIASAAFLAISPIHIYRSNIAIPEPISLLGMLLFFHAITLKGNTRQYLLAGFFASMVFLTNIISTMYFLPSVITILLVLLLLRHWSAFYKLLMATLLGLAVSSLFWFPTLYQLGFKGVLEGLGPPFVSGSALIFTSHTYFSWIGWGPCILGILGAYVCLRGFKSYLLLLVPPTIIMFLFEAANNGFHVLNSQVLFRGLLYLGTWVSLLAGVGFKQLERPTRKLLTMVILSAIIIPTVASFPIVSNARYPRNWEYHDSDFTYRSYLDHYADIFESKEYRVYSAEWETNYGAFENVILDREAPQIRDAVVKKNVSMLLDTLHDREIRYLIFRSETDEVKFLTETNLFHTYYSNWHTTVLSLK